MHLLDVNDDGHVSPLDVVLIINELNRTNTVASAMRPAAVAVGSATVASAVQDLVATRSADARDQPVSQTAADAADHVLESESSVELTLLEFDTTTKSDDWDGLLSTLAAEKSSVDTEVSERLRLLILKPPGFG